jgi:hypothetical protein
LLVPLSWSAIQPVSGLVIHCSLGLNLCATRLAYIVVPDGHPLDDGEWDMRGNSYRVFLDGKWVVVPDDTVISGPNKLGKAIVWFQKPAELEWGGETGTPIWCFIPGSGV